MGFVGSDQRRAGNRSFPVWAWELQLGLLEKRMPAPEERLLHWVCRHFP